MEPGWQEYVSFAVSLFSLWKDGGRRWLIRGFDRYVGIEEGIFEFAVNIQNRKTFPGVTMQ